jgi:hypothetical protein
MTFTWTGTPSRILHILLNKSVVGSKEHCHSTEHYTDSFTQVIHVCIQEVVSVHILLLWNYSMVLDDTFDPGQSTSHLPGKFKFGSHRFNTGFGVLMAVSKLKSSRIWRSLCSSVDGYQHFKAAGYSSTIKMVATRSSKTLVPNHQNTWCHTSRTIILVTQNSNWALKFIKNSSTHENRLYMI